MSKIFGYEKNLFVDHSNDYRDGKSLENPNSKLYGQQDKVDKLPIPDLKASIDLYLQSLLPLTSPQEFYRSKQLSEKFYTGIGPVLQERLKERAMKKKDTSWFAEWWNDLGYLGYRSSIVHNVTYYLQFSDEPQHAMDQCRRAARIVYHTASYRKQVITGELSPDLKKNGKPMSNTQWKFIFNTCRIPEKPKDIVRTYAGDVYGHIIVAVKNHFFSLKICDKNMNPCSISEIEASLQAIQSYADTIGTNNTSIGILTTDDRDIWTENYKILCENKVNKASIEEIQSSMFMICLDDSSPVTRDQIGLKLLHSEGSNRYWDKSFQIVVFKNGKAGYVGEHSMADGTTSTRIVNGMLDALFSDSDSVRLANTPVQPATFPKLLKFELSSEMLQEVSASLVRFKEALSEKELKVLMFHGFGKEKIKSFKCSPDAFAQVAMQVAYYKTFGYCRATYESTQTRNFLHGRTEVTRSCSIQSLRFSRKLVDATEPTASYEKDCYDLLQQAVNAHVSYIRRASQAQGCDRHFLGLKLLLQEGEDKSFFEDKSYKTSGNWSISTSGLVGEKMDGWGFGEVTIGGIGIGYSVQKNRLRFTVTSAHKQDQWASRMCANLEWTLLQMEDLCTKYTKTTKSKL